MNILKITLLAIPLFILGSCNSDKSNKAGLDVVFQETTTQFSQIEKQTIEENISSAYMEVKALLPNVPNDIQLIVEIVDWNLNNVGGVTGRTESNSPAVVAIQISNTFDGGLSSAVEIGLKSTLYHEFHHLSRGWAIQDNKFGPGITIAIVNEGLAEVFAEEYTGAIFEENHMPEGTDGDSWIKEIMALPKHANYQIWMFEHPDGRTSIGYRSGNFLVRKIMNESGKNILELSKLSPIEIIKLAGY
ncbi:DUF2268 domain-containing putative Zn-dependent protease [Marivirga arenosa]|uniref:DUF2268 domain-containing putative Zn-dependent protease n=1 Tax=Marivirga arenosa TaxID=3059076 RepID=A0AA49GDZ0_9BACT|nr:DUF2268 domain-containing putative Zn-dependent protease [Marivirga sp. BKB1-2]WKK81060.2 DUF2268 domain-containing putative Zn-dependent protease [Marivirga sp. BKB1-2]